MPIEAVEALKSKDVDIVSVIAFAKGLNDSEVLDLANRENRIVVTFDKGFGELVVKEKMKVRGLILLRFTPKSPQQVVSRIWQLLTSQIPIENNFVVVRDFTVRVVKLKY